MNTQLNTKRILIFLAFAFGIPWAAALVLYLTVGMDDLAKAQGLANNIAISTPWLANVATRLITKEGRERLMLRPNFRRGWRFYLAAWLLPLLALIVGGAAFYLLFPQSFDPNLGELQKNLAGSPFGTDANPWMVWLIQALVQMITIVPMVAVLCFGEEFGWRGYLLPKLVEHFAGASVEDLPHTSGLNTAGARKAALLVGVIHGVWHWPLICMAAKYNPGLTILSLLIYFIFSCSLSVLLSWVTLRSGSMWPAAVVHATLPAYGMLVVSFPLKGPAIPLLGPDADGLIGGIGFTILALILLFSRRAFVGGKQPAVSENLQAKEYSTLV